AKQAHGASQHTPPQCDQLYVSTPPCSAPLV
ncbi:hypothetical protein A2U01_0116036, partial [Trifolium medium]|nr:hypothetical protein [Trifolium medium]